MTLKTFPRGGTKAAIKSKTGLTFHNKYLRKNKRKNYKKKLQDEKSDGAEKTYLANSADCLTYSTVSENMIVLGRIQQVTEYDIVVSLPGHLRGKVQATNISKSYTNLLRSIVDLEKDKLTNFKPLSSLYKHGEYIICYIKSNNLMDKWKISLSLEPEFINRNLDPLKLIKGSKIVGCISSLEDHGYVIDTGIENLRSFLDKRDVDDGVNYHVGRQIFCAVKNVQIIDGLTTVQLSTKKKHTETAMIEDGQTLDAQLPGTEHILTVQRILFNGLQVTFGNRNIGYVNAIHMNEPLQSYECGNVIHGKLMYVMPMVKYAYFSLLSSNNESECLKIGDEFDKAKVLFVSARGVVVSLINKIRGLIPLRRTGVVYDKISSKFGIGTHHKCRVLSYDSFDRVYVCTVEQYLLNEKHLTTSSLQIGEILTVEIVDINPKTGFIKVTSGRIKGWVPPEHAKDLECPIRGPRKIGDVIKARVLGLDKMQRSVLLTLKKSLIDSELPILAKSKDITIGGKHHGTIVQINDRGILVCFYGQMKGWIPSSYLNRKYTSTTQWNFIIGQTITVIIENVGLNNNKLTLNVCQETNEILETADFDIGESVEGTVVESSVEGVHLRFPRKNLKNPITGFLPAGHMAPCVEIGGYMSARCSIGETVSAHVFSTRPLFILTRTFFPNEKYRDFNNLKIGDCLPCSIHEIHNGSLKLIMPLNNYDSYGTVAACNVEKVGSLRIHQILFARVISIDHKNRKIDLTTTLCDVLNSMSEDDDPMESVDLLSLHFNKLRELSENDYYKSRPISKVQIGEKIGGTVENVTLHGVVLKLNYGVTGTVRPDHCKGKLKPGDRVNGTIIWINYVHELAEVTLLPSFEHVISSKQTLSVNSKLDGQLRGDIVLVTNWFILLALKGSGKGTFGALPIRRHINDVEPDLTSYSIGRKIRCYVVLGRSEANFPPICLLKSSFEATKMFITRPVPRRVKRKSSFSESCENSFGIVKKVKTTTTKLNGDPMDELTKPKNKRAKCMMQEVESTITTKRESVKTIMPGKNARVNTGKSRKLKLQKMNEIISDMAKVKETEMEVEPAGASMSEMAVETIRKNSSKKKTKKVDLERHIQNEKIAKLENLEEDTIIESDVVFSESDIDNANWKNSRLTACGFFWDNKLNNADVTMEESSSGDEDDNENDNEQKIKKFRTTEGRESERLKEREIRKCEEAVSTQAPNCVDQFERLVLSSPDNSMIWLRYMAYHLQSTETDKARAVAKRAIKTINFREESERINIWKAWLNLESRFGNPESLNSVFQEAVKTNDACKIYLHMLTVHADADRRAELYKIFTTIIGKFKQVPHIWIECGAVFYKLGLEEKSRHIMQRALQSLPPQEHVNLMVKFAQLEIKYGDKERAQTLFDQVLSSYPKRIDLWSSYVDTLIKYKDFAAARKVLEKAVVQTIPARKMKALFKKFIDFEQKNGSLERVSYVQQLAEKYVENQCNKEKI